MTLPGNESPEVYYSSLEEQYLVREGVDLRRTLTRPGLAYDGGIFAFLTEGGLVVRVGDDAASSAIESGHGAEYRSESESVVGGWLLVPFDPADPHRWAHYVELAYGHSRLTTHE